MTSKTIYTDTMFMLIIIFVFISDKLAHHMYLLQDECSFVSLRDVERVLDVMSWFYKTTFDEDHFLRSSDSEDSSDEEDMFIETNV